MTSGMRCRQRADEHARGSREDISEEPQEEVVYGTVMKLMSFRREPGGHVWGSPKRWTENAMQVWLMSQKGLDWVGAPVESQKGFFFHWFCWSFGLAAEEECAVRFSTGLGDAR